MRHPALPPQFLWYSAQVVAVAALYLAIAKLSLMLAIPPGYASAVWPPSGVALALVLLGGNRLWPGIWIGAAVANLLVQASIPAAVLIGTGNALEAVVGATLALRYIGVPRCFNSGEDVFKFVAIGALAATVAASIGVSAIALTGAIRPGDFLAHWWTWWQGDVSGIIVVTPLLLCVTARRAVRRSPKRKLETIGFALALAAASYVVIAGGSNAPAFSPPLLLVTFPFIVWAAFRFDQLEVTVAIAALCAIAIASTIDGADRLAAGSDNASLLLLLAFVSVVGVTGLVLSAVVGERRRAMEALRAGHGELESRVEARTLELQLANQSLQNDLGIRAKLEDELRRSEEKFRLLVEGIQEYAIYMLDPDGYVTSWNAGAEKIKGYKAEEIIGRHFSCFYPLPSIEARLPQEQLERAVERGSHEDEGWRLRKDGTPFWANGTVTALLDASGNLRGFAKVTRDLTDRRRIQTLEYGERRTQEFIAMLAHELRNPLTPIRNAVDLMRVKSQDGPTQEWSVDIIDRQLTHLTRLVDDLLDVGRIASGKIVLHKEPFDVNAAVLRAVAAIRPAADASGLDLQAHVAAEPVFIDGDSTRFSQAVLNLLNNSIKYTRAGGRIAVAVDREGTSAVIRVTDTGIGIAEELLPSIFDLFVQGARSLERAEGGLGIGLSVVKRLISLHGGTVEARSDGPGRGSEFVIRLPAMPAGCVPARSAPDARLPSRGRRRVLVVDDHRDSADTMSALVAAWGHEVRTLYDGPSAITAVQDFGPHVVILDIGLPGMDGYEVATALRNSAGVRPAILIAFTGYGQDEDRRRVREAGFDHHLVKPLDPVVLEKILQAVAENAGQI